MTRCVVGRFDKTHSAVLRAYDTLSGSVKSRDAKMLREIFRETSYPNSRGQTQRELLMTHDGFILLAMGVYGRPG